MVSVDRLHELLRLDSETGKLFWRSTGSGRKRSEAGSIDGEGYRVVTINHRPFKAHRIVFALTLGRWPVEQIDHINGIRDDNRIVNLREATSAQNKQNTGLMRTNTSGQKGVSWHKRTGTWEARIMVNRRNIILGHFTNIEAASLVYRVACLKYHGDFARLL